MDDLGVLVALFLPFLLIPAIPFVGKQSLLRFLDILFFILGLPTIINLIIFKLGKPILNGPVSLLIVFGLGPFSICLILSRLRILWRYKIFGIVCIILTYLLGIIFFINIGMALQIISP